MNKFLFTCNKSDHQTAIIGDEDFRHCVKVLRYGLQDAIQCTDGNGNHYVGKIMEIRKKELVMMVEEHHEYPPRDKRLHIVIAPTKNLSRIETMVEKCVEIGVDEISFITTKNSERKVIKITRIEKIAWSALKQSHQYRLPKINEMVSLSSFLKDASANDKKYLLHYHESATHLLDASWSENNILLVGPEGDFTKDEIELCNKSGFETKILGDNKLRTETAGIVACSIFNVINR